MNQSFPRSYADETRPEIKAPQSAKTAVHRAHHVSLNATVLTSRPGNGADVRDPPDCRQGAKRIVGGSPPCPQASPRNALSFATDATPARP
jgi:hypothetical protein